MSSVIGLLPVAVHSSLDRLWSFKRDAFRAIIGAKRRESGRTLRSSTDLHVADVEQALHGPDGRQKFLNNDLVVETQLTGPVIARRPQDIPADTQQCSPSFVTHILRILLQRLHATLQALVHVDVDRTFDGSNSRRSSVRDRRRTPACHHFC